MSDKNFKVKSGLQVPSLATAGPVITDSSGNVTSSATLPVSQGGTGQTTAGNALNAILPLQTSNDNKYLQTNGVNTQWNTVLQPVYADNAPSSPQVGQVWIESDSSSDSFDPNIIRRKSFTATAAQTVFTTDLEFIQGYEQVFFNGMLLLRGLDYTTASNTNVTLTSGAAAGDIVEIVSITNLNSINAATTTTNIFTGAQTMNQTLAINTTIQGSSRLQVNYDTTAGGYPWDNSAMVIRDSRTMTSGVGGGIIFEGNYLTTGGMSAYGGIRGRKSNSTNGDPGGFLDLWSRAAGIRFFKSEQLVGSEGTSDMIIDSSGNIGVSTDSPITFNPDSNYNKVLAIRQTDQVLSLGSYWQAGVGQSSFINSSQSTSRTNASNLFFQTGGTNKFLIEANGNAQIVNNPVDTLRYFDIYNTNSGNSAGTIIRFITNNAANTAVTTVDMVKYRNGYFGISNNDSAATIGFGTAGTERMRIINTGAVVIGHTSALNNEAFGVRTGANIQNIWSDSIDPNYSTVAFGNRITRANTSAYTFLQNWSSGGADTEHYLRGDGQAYADGSWNGGGADYAEYFEWEDGNINNEDRRGYSVSLVNNKIKIAEEGDSVVGVVSGNPSVVGDDAPMKWSGKYLKDDFGSYIRDEDGYRILNPEYDEEAEYISREDRSEWSTIGLMGKLRLRKGQLVGAGWIKMRDISETVEEWLVK